MKGNKTTKTGTFLVVQWLRISLPMQETWVRSLVGKLRSHVLRSNYQACTLQNLCAATRKAHAPPQRPSTAKKKEHKIPNDMFKKLCWKKKKKLCWKNNMPYIAVQMPGLKAAASLLPSFANLDFKAGGPRGDCWEGASIFMYRIPTASSSKMQNLLCRMTAENNQEARLH